MIYFFLQVAAHPRGMSGQELKQKQTTEECCLQTPASSWADAQLACLCSPSLPSQEMMSSKVNQALPPQLGMKKSFKYILTKPFQPVQSLTEISHSDKQAVLCLQNKLTRTGSRVFQTGIRLLFLLPSSSQCWRLQVEASLPYHVLLSNEFRMLCMSGMSSISLVTANAPIVFFLLKYFNFMIYI